MNISSLHSIETAGDLFSFRQYVDSTVRQTKRGSLVLVDIEDFKKVNYRFGTVTGDQTLMFINQKLSEHLNKCYDDDISVLHHHKDVYLIFIPTETTQEEAVTLFTVIREVLDKPFHIGDANFKLDFRMALTNASSIANSFDNLVESVEYSIRLAKVNGDRFIHSQSAIPAAFQSSTSFCQAFDDAVTNNELRFVFQPKHDMSKTGKIVGCEALARWYDEDGNLYPLPVVLDAIFTNNKFQDFAKYTLSSAVRLLRELVAKQKPLVKVSINMDVQQIADKSVFHYFVRMANDFPELVQFIEIELTEDNLLSKHVNSLRNLKLLQRTGFKVSIDDFGKGYSNLRSIIEIQPDTIKIDKSFIDFITTCESTIKVLQAIVMMELCAGDIVAEGVEKEEQVEKLLSLGIKTAQGYFYNRPLQRDDFISQL